MAKRNWYYRTPDSETHGPLSLAQMAALLQAGEINGTTVTRTGESGPWTPFRERNEFRDAKEIPAEEIQKVRERKAGAGWLSRLFGGK